MKAVHDSVADDLTAQWTRLGAVFNVPAAAATPDLERLIIQTARHAHNHGRLMTMASTWLAHYPLYVAKRRLAVLAETELEDEYLPVLGLMLEWAKLRSRPRTNQFNDALAVCHPAEDAGPLLEIARQNRAMRKISEQQATALSRKWGRWFQMQDKQDAIRPADWIGRHNPDLTVRALMGGDLSATIVADAIDAAQHQREFPSEAGLARRYKASRAAVRAALRRLNMAGWVTQRVQGKSKLTVIAPRLEALGVGRL